MASKQFEIPCDLWVEVEVGEDEPSYCPFAMDQQWRMSSSIKCRTIYMAG